MTKISLDPEQGEVSVTRSIGKDGDGKITINREGGGAIEINLGVASIGLTTDYGGAISLGIAGQEVTWGREGGTIHIGIGGFAVDVEARDCIVTEIKSIAGIIVAQRSYPDPGCKLPDPREPPDPPPMLPGTPGEGIEIPDTDALGWVVCDEIVERYGAIDGSLRFIDGGTYSRAATDIDTPVTSSIVPFTVTETVAGSPLFAHKITKGRSPRYRSIVVVLNDGSGASGSFVLSDSYSSDGGITYRPTFRQDSNNARPLCYYGSAKNFNKLKNCLDQRKRERIAAIVEASKDGYRATDTLILTPTQYIPLIPVKNKPRQLLPTGNKPPMKDCCEEILDYLADLEEAFEIQRLLKDKFPVSNTFMAPECDPATETKAKSYYEIVQCAFRMLAHGLIFEPRVQLKDADAAKAGDQEFKAKYLNATGWASAMAEALLEVKDDGNVSTNMDIRNGFAATQTMVGLADAIYRLEAIIDCLGVEVIPKVETVETPYNLQIKIGKGFGEGNERQIDLNTDEATEKLLPTLLQVKKNKIKTVDIHPRSRSIKEILENIEANLQGVSSDQIV